MEVSTGGKSHWVQLSMKFTGVDVDVSNMLFIHVENVGKYLDNAQVSMRCKIQLNSTH